MKTFKKFSNNFSNSSRLKSQRRLLSWAKKQKHKSIVHFTNIIPNAPLQCPLIGCLGYGHVNGKSVSHITLSGCPSFHNLPFDKWAEMCAREEGVFLFEDSIKPSPSKHTKMLDRSFQFKTSCKEPLLDGLASQMEIYQFRRAQQRLVSSKEIEAREHLYICARIASEKVNVTYNENDEYVLYQRIRHIVFGSWEFQPLYRSNYPPDLSCMPTIYVCEFCLTALRHNIGYERHRVNCGQSFPPGNEIYRKENLSFFEVDGQKHPEYCQNLCLLTKLFLKQKTVHEVEKVVAFLFYVLTETDQHGSHIIGYFSKQKAEDQCDANSTNVPQYNNLSCILILPPYQCRGYGRMLIEMSYALSRIEERVGSPERPLSDLGLIMYRKFWRYEILNYLVNFAEKSMNIRTMSQQLGIAIPDIVSTLLDMKMLVYYRTEYYIVNNKNNIDALLSDIRVPDANRRIDSSCIFWDPGINSINKLKQSSSCERGLND